LFSKGHIPVRTINGKQEAYFQREEIPTKDYEKEIALVNKIKEYFKKLFFFKLNFYSKSSKNSSLKRSKKQLNRLFVVLGKM
jgi:hypothetical protein